MSGFTLGREDHDMVRDYITAKDEYHYAGLPEDVVAIVVTHSNLPSKFMDLRFNLHTTLGEVKERFRLHFGTPVEFQRLTLLDGDRLLCKMNDNSKKLGYYSVESGNIVHIVDEDPFSLSKNGGLTDTSLVEKVRMSDKDYDKRDNSVRKQIQEAKAKKALEKMLAKENPAERGEPAADEGADSVKHIVDINDDGVVNGIGARCEVQPGARRGVVAWVGESEHLKVGHWVGVKFDEPVGKSDGSIKGTKYFECSQGYGGFLRGKNVKVGDYPEHDIFDDDSEEENAENEPSTADDDEM